MHPKFRSVLLRHRWAIFVALLVLTGLAVWWQMTRPLATLVLPDGTTILLRKISLGPEHFYREPHPDRASLSDRIRHPFGRKDTLPSHSPVLFLTEKSPGSSEEHPVRLPSIIVRFEGARPLSHVPHHPIGDYTIVHSLNYPRREKTMRLNLSIGGKWHEWDLPNPLYGTSFPTWTAQPFPQTIKEGDFEFTATGWTLNDYGWGLAGGAKYRGKPADHRMIVGEAKDATGNEGDPILMPLGESAWRIDVTVTIGEREPLSPDRLVDFGTAKVPADGQYIVLSVPPKMEEGQITFAALVGKGTFAFRNGNNAPSEAPPATANPKYPNVTHRVDKDGWLVRGEVPAPAFVMFEMASQPGSTFQSDTLALKCFASGDVQTLNNDGASRKDSEKGGSRQLRRAMIHKFPVGTEVGIRSVRPEILKMNGILVPPPSPAERAGAESEFQKRYEQASP